MKDQKSNAKVKKPEDENINIMSIYIEGEKTLIWAL